MIVGVGAWRGSGATTVAMLLASALAARGERPWLVDADPAGGTVAPLLGLAHAGGLEEVAFGAGTRTAVERLRAAAVPVGRVLLVAAPGDPYRAATCHEPRVPWQAALRELDGPVVVDLGRMRNASTVAVRDQLDVLLLVTTSEAVAVATTLDWADVHGRTAPDQPAMHGDRVAVCVIEAPGAAHPVDAREAAIECGRRWAGWLPWSPEEVRALAQPGRHGPRRRPLGAAVAAMAAGLDARAAPTRALEPPAVARTW